MTTTALRAHLNAQPFRPFVMSLASGREIEVTYPEAVAYGNGRMVGVWTPDDAILSVDLLLVDSIRAATPRAPKGKRPR